MSGKPNPKIKFGLDLDIWLMPYKDATARKEAHKRWYLKNKDRHYEKHKKYCKANAENRRVWMNNYQKTWRARPENKEKLRKTERASKLKQKFGISEAEYDTLLEKQISVCAICNRPDPNFRLAVDHDHISGEIRGLLCSRCNPGLGYFQDNEALLFAAIEYLRKTKIKENICEVA